MDLRGASRCVRRMRTRLSPRCTSNSATPLSFTMLISSRISSIVMQSVSSQFAQFFWSRGQGFASGLRDDHRVLDATPAESLQIYSRLDRDSHTNLQAGLIL